MEVPSIFINRILTEMAKKGASNIHFSVGSVPVLRLEGSLVFLNDENIMTKDVLDKIISSNLDERELKILEEKKEIIIAKIFNKEYRFRIDIYYQKNLPSISFNYIPNKIRNFDDLSLPSQVKELINFKSGLLVIAGPNNSGKTSTISVLIEEVNNKAKKHILTLENPIEYSFVNKKSIIEQRQIGQDVNSYIDGLDHCLKENIDIVYIDEIKDNLEDAIPLIFDLAAGNSLVVIEVNSTSSIRVIEKLLDAARKKLSPEAARYSLADVLIGIITQYLIPGRSGGLVPAYEILVSSSAIKSLIRDSKFYQIDSVIQTSRGEGMVSMKKSIEELLVSGKITKEEVDKLKL